MSINLEELTSRKTVEEYPNIVIVNPNDTVPVVIKSLEEGETQLIIEWQGKRKCVKRISKSAYNIDKLLRTTGSIFLNFGGEKRIEVPDIETYLSCVI